MERRENESWNVGRRRDSESGDKIRRVESGRRRETETRSIPIPLAKLSCGVAYRAIWQALCTLVALLLDTEC